MTANRKELQILASEIAYLIWSLLYSKVPGFYVRPHRLSNRALLPSLLTKPYLEDLVHDEPFPLA